MEISLRKINSKPCTTNKIPLPPSRKYSSKISLKRGVSWARNLWEVSNMEDFGSQKRISADRDGFNFNKSNIKPKSILKKKRDNSEVPKYSINCKFEELKHYSNTPSRKSKFHLKKSSRSHSRNNSKNRSKLKIITHFTFVSYDFRFTLRIFLATNSCLFNYDIRWTNNFM